MFVHLDGRVWSFKHYDPLGVAKILNNPKYIKDPLPYTDNFAKYSDAPNVAPQSKSKGTPKGKGGP